MSDQGVPYFQPVVLAMLFSWLESQQKILWEGLRDQGYMEQDLYTLIIVRMRIFKWFMLRIRKKSLPL